MMMHADIMSLSPDLDAFLRPTPEGARIDLAVEGIRCAGCMATIEREMLGLSGVTSARVNLADKRLSVTFGPGKSDPAGVVRHLATLGFRAWPFSPHLVGEAISAEGRRLMRALGVAGFAAMNIMLLSVAVWSGHETGLDATTRDMFHWISALIALPTAAYSGRPFFDSAIRALRARRVNMDVPITLGICLALGMSVIEVLRHGEHAYFDGAVMLIFFLLIGRVLEHLMQRRTRAVAANLAALRAERATKRLPDGTWREVPIDMVEPGDIVLVKAGERISADGMVETGISDLDQSLVTGETAHRAVKAGEMVHAGTLNLSGALTLRVLRPHDSTLLADIERLLARASEVRGAYVRLADRAARLYPPLVHSVALLAFLGWMLAGLGWHDALVIAITVLIITCPCALGLAIPAVQVVAAGALFRRGVLIHGGDALERLAETDCAVLDKTGTLTLPAAEIANLADIAPAALALAARLALTSRHPLAAAIAAYAGKGDPFPNAREIPGQGVAACQAGKVLQLGSPVFCDAQDEAAELVTIWPEASIVAFRAGNERVLFAIRQPYREDASDTVARLEALGLPVELLSGDRSGVVAAAAARTGIREWRGDILPGGKVQRLESLKAAGRKPLMIGDGLNDAPALAAAHASMAPASAVHLAQTQADFLLLGGRLGAAVDAIATARKARRLMLQNLWFSVLYNLVAVPIAVFGHATPLVAALAMSGSSVIVTLNALRAARIEGNSA